MRIGVVNGNGYQCDTCGKLLYSKDVIRVKSFIPKKVDNNTGEYVILDVIGVCQNCYKKHFAILNGRGMARERKSKCLSVEQNMK